MEKKINKIMVFGRPASGKSTFSLMLSKATGLPVFHLDKYFFKPDWIKKSRIECEQILKKFVEKDQWIIDGNDPSLLEMRYEKADLILYFDLPKWLCLYRAFKRLFFKTKGLDDRAKGCKEKLSLGFVSYILSFEKYFESEVSRLVKHYPKKKFIKIINDKGLDESFKYILESL